MEMNEQALMEAQEQIFDKAAYLMEHEWKDHIEAIQEAVQDVDEITLATTAIILENTKKYMERMDESTKSVNIGSFQNFAFDMISAVMPSLIANQIVSVQPMQNRIGQIFFLEFLYGTTKGGITAGDKMFAANAAGNANIHYTDEVIDGEAVGAAGSTNYTGNLSFIPVRAGTLVFTDGTQTVTDDGAGNLIGDIGAGANTINYTSGAFDVTFNAATGADVTVTYEFNFEENPSLIPEVNISLTSAPVTARMRKLRALYSLDAGYDLQQIFGKSADTELTTALSSEIRQEIDGDILTDLLNAASVSLTPFSLTPPDPSIPFRDHKFDFINTIIDGSNTIFDNTRRAEGNFIVAGTDVMRLLESLEGRYEKNGRLQPGPHFAGTLDGSWRVFKNPFYPKKTFVLGYKGDLFLEAGYVYAPYMPLFTTPNIMLDDFVSRKGMATSYGKKIVNGDFFVKGTITP